MKTYSIDAIFSTETHSVEPPSRMAVTIYSVHSTMLACTSSSPSDFLIGLEKLLALSL